MTVLRFLINVALFMVPAALLGFWSARLARESRDEWQLMAWVPTAPLAIWGVYIAIGVTRDPTSHNLWPFELVIWLVLSLALFGAFLGVRRLAGGKNAA